METLRRLADGLIALAAAIGALGLLVEGAVILTDVVGRALARPLYGSQDLITMTMIILLFGAMAQCDRKGGHISVDLLERYFPPVMNRAIDVISAVLGAVIFLGLAWAVWQVIDLNMRFGISSKTNLLRLPIDAFRWVMAGFAVLTALAMLLRAAELAFRGVDVRRDGEAIL